MVTPHVSRSGSLTLSPAGWLVWHPEPHRDPQPLPPEWALRVWTDVDLDDDASLMTILDLYGMVWGDVDRTRDDELTPVIGSGARLPDRDEPDVMVHIAEVREHLVTLRDLAVWLAAGTGLDEPWWRVLNKGLAPFTPVTLARTAEPVVDLYEAGCWQLYVAATSELPLRVCQCGQAFYRKDGVSRRTADSLYCSERCRARTRQRRHRARNRAAITT